MKRIVVIGNNGVGKSTFSAELGEKLNLPVIHLDAYFHKSNFQKVSTEEWNKIHAEFILKDKWIMDGTYKRTLDTRIKASDTIIFLDLPKRLAFYRMFKRRIIYRNKTRPDLPKEFKEHISFILFRKNLTFSNKVIYKMLEPYKETKEIIILKNQSDVQNFLKT